MKHLVIPILTAVATVLNPAPSYADLGDQITKLLPLDGGFADRFGWSVAISGNIAIVGSRTDNNNNGINSGAAYLFNITTSQQLFKLMPNDGEADEEFGWSVAISGTTAIVGTLRDDENGEASGSAYLFDTITGNQLFKLLPDDGAMDDFFGRSVAISGTTAIVGAFLDDDNDSGSGSAYLFDITTGNQLFKLLPEDGEFDDQFGYSVAIYGSTAIVGAYYDDDNGSDSGSAYLFDIVTGQQIAKLVPNDGAAADEFGWFVALSATTAIVGAHHDDDNGNDSGSAYLFDITSGQQITKILAIDGAAQDEFGYSVAISGNIATVGAFFDDDNGDASGSAYLFDITTGQQIFKLLPNDGIKGDQFGKSVAISGDTAIVGAFMNDGAGTGSGSAYLFDSAIPCPWDLNNDETIGTSDLLILFAFWGKVDVFPDADLNGDGFINTVDLLILFANWGACP